MSRPTHRVSVASVAFLLYHFNHSRASKHLFDLTVACAGMQSNPKQSRYYCNRTNAEFMDRRPSFHFVLESKMPIVRLLSSLYE